MYTQPSITPDSGLQIIDKSLATNCFLYTHQHFAEIMTTGSLTMEVKLFSVFQSSEL
jgi:hypothetical protein